MFNDSTRSWLIRINEGPYKFVRQVTLQTLWTLVCPD